ncbi:MAG: feoB [Bacillales bacterium]|jgi:ferrous iron transport protein B|nr:feoB [Bacillales bacterium]
MEIGLIGNPNTGKTSLFNSLTGSYEYVGNWSGVTVEKKVGKLNSDNNSILIDLPGIYSTNPISKDEAISTHYLINETYDGLINIVDSSKLSRNLFLTLSILELGVPVIIVLNMIDVAKKRGINIDIQKLEKMIGVRVIKSIARKDFGVNNILNELFSISKSKKSFEIYYGNVIELSISKIIPYIPTSVVGNRKWYAIQCLEGNSIVINHILQKCSNKSNFNNLINEQQKLLNSHYNTKNLKSTLMKIRNIQIDNIISACVTINKYRSLNYTKYIDNFVLNSFFGPLIFLTIMLIVFKITFEWIGGPLSNIISTIIIQDFSIFVGNSFEALGVKGWIVGSVLNGIIPGVGGVISFFPQVFLLFFFISLLEDSGYMVRIAVLFDRLMEYFGLNGKSLIPMIIGFGCNAPAVMATRTIENNKERLLTILVLPFMSCSARLTVYGMFVSVFFANHQAVIFLGLYIFGIIIAFIIAKFFSKILFKNEETIFWFELPPYRIPHVKTILRATWEKGKGFIEKAGTTIFLGSLLVWFLGAFGPSGYGVTIENSFLAIIGSKIGDMLSPLGFGSWQAGVALLTGFVAKEIIVSTMNIVFQSNSTSQLSELLNQNFTFPSAISFLIFVLLYVPCIATIATIIKETKSFTISLFSAIYPFVIAYIISLIIYQTLVFFT